MAKASRQTRLRFDMKRVEKEMGAISGPNVIEWARKHPKSFLHDEIDWKSAKKAEEQYLLAQARRLIKEFTVVVTVPAGFDPRAIDVQVEVSDMQSLPGDRKKKEGSGGGRYRHIDDILDDADGRLELLQETIRRLAGVAEAKLFPELAEIVNLIAIAKAQYVDVQYAQAAE